MEPYLLPGILLRVLRNTEFNDKIAMALGQRARQEAQLVSRVVMRPSILTGKYLFIRAAALRYQAPPLSLILKILLPLRRTQGK